MLPPCEVVIKAVSEYVSSIKDLGNLDAIARDVFKQSQVFQVCAAAMVADYEFPIANTYHCVYASMEGTRLHLQST